MPVELKVPNAGESITQVQIGEWKIAEGGTARRDQVVVEIETDKASMEVPAPVTGKVVKVLKKAGQTAKIGEVIGVMEESTDVSAEKATPAGESPAVAKAPRDAASATAIAPADTPAKAPPPAPAKESTAPSGISSRGHVMPSAARVLAQAGVDSSSVTGTGPGGRILKEDAQRHVAGGQSARTPMSGVWSGSGGLAHSQNGAREEDAVPMTLLRRRVAERLVSAQQNAALLTTFNEIDMGAVMALRKERGDAFLARHGVKLGFMSFFVKAAIDALRLVPQINAEIREQPGEDGRPTPHIVYKNYFDIGVAVGGGKGLVVPILRSAERMSFADVEKTISDFGMRAKENKLALEELQGGTFTISNGGVYGSLLSTPIINPPQSGILGLHAIQDRPVARDGQIVIRPMMYIALTYDHRIVDGREAVTFLKRIKDCVEDPTRMLIEV